LINMLIGFVVLATAAAAGAFVAGELTDAYVSDPALVTAWGPTLRASAHGHVNLFALTHVALGLTLPYSRFGAKVKLAQTIGLACGVVAMGPLMLWRAALGAPRGNDALGVAIGVLLALALAAIASHAAGLGARLIERR
jgi:hypothetical protein